jgi:aldose 1-epimerase
MIGLQAGRLRCQVDPSAGGGVAGLWLDGRALLHAAPGEGGCRPLVPFSNRIGHAEVVWQGTQEPRVRHTGDAPHAIRGLAWQRPWAVLDEDAASAMLAFEHKSGASWPFAFDCSHTVRLQPSGLELTLALTNQSSEPAPAGLGWRAALPKRAASHLTLHAQSRWMFDEQQLPTRRAPDRGMDLDLAGVALEHCFSGWDGVLRLGDAAGSLQLRSELTCVYAWSAADADFLVAEPVSHPPNAVHLYAGGAAAADLGLVLLQPGESLLAQMRIEVEGAA